MESTKESNPPEEGNFSPYFPHVLSIFHFPSHHLKTFPYCTTLAFIKFLHHPPHDLPNHFDPETVYLSNANKFHPFLLRLKILLAPMVS